MFSGWLDLDSLTACPHAAIECHEAKGKGPEVLTDAQGAESSPQQHAQGAGRAIGDRLTRDLRTPASHSRPLHTLPRGGEEGQLLTAVRETCDTNQGVELRKATSTLVRQGQEPRGK
jgi:hypothetical protein